jgi:hypothetical protein
VTTSEVTDAEIFKLSEEELKGLGSMLKISALVTFKTEVSSE